jgi:prolyl-tRNA editing enzyme YbaK/EbsC (Cys-tRNA(Pro) deacylase)
VFNVSNVCVILQLKTHLEAKKLKRECGAMKKKIWKRRNTKAKGGSVSLPPNFQRNLFISFVI